MRVLVTGAQGCIGAWIVRSLLGRDAEVVTYDLESEPSRLRMIAPAEQVNRVHIRVGQIEDTERLKAIVKDDGITHIVHLAAQLMPFCQKFPVAGAMANVIGTLNVFEAVRDSGRAIPIVYASSSAVWGPGETYGDRAVSEEDPARPATHYGVFKHANESSARIFFESSGIHSIGLRPWTVYGVGRDKGLTADPTLAIKAVALQKNFQIRLTGYMDFQYVEDVAETFVRCLLSGLEGSHIFNLAGDVCEIAEFCRILIEVEPSAKQLISSSGPQVPVAFRMDASQLHAHVPGIPRTPLSDGVAKTYSLFTQLHREGRLPEELG